MSQQRSTDYIAPFKLARQAQVLKGVLPLSSMTRLGHYLSSEEGEVNYEIHFGIDEGRTYYARGYARAELRMECQRCMTPVAVMVEAEIKVAFVSSDEQAARVAEEFDPCVVEDEKLVLLEMIEDELILALPIVARHDDPGCQAWLKEKGETEIEAPSKENPFEVLARLKRSGD